MKINDWEGSGYIVLDKETGSAAYMISGGLSGGSTSIKVKLAILVNLAMIIYDMFQAIAIIGAAASTGGLILGLGFLGLAAFQYWSLIDYYQTGNDEQIIKDAITGVAATGAFTIIKHLACKAKLLLGMCFTEDTKVLTKEGYKKISEIEEGEEVESFNEKTGEKGLKKVLAVHVSEAQKLINIKTERAEIKVTPSHPMLKIGNTWVFAGALKVGDKLAGYDGDEVEVKEIEEEPLESSEKVYNLTVEDYHTYVVSEDSVVVHNKCDLLGIKRISKITPDIIPNKGFNSFNKLKKYLGSPGEGKAWHHIVEQSQIGKRADFPITKVNNVNNVIAIPHGSGTIHSKISSHYSSKVDWTDGLTVRD